METLTLADIAARLLTALACGAVIGLNRDLHHKPAGFRTFGLVSLGSAVATLVMLEVLGAGADAVSRVIQGVLTGIGFLGAGVILHRETRAKVAGLTTAAAVWLTAVLGIAAGVGRFTIVWFALILAMALLVAGGPIERSLERLFGRGQPDRPKSPGE